MRSLIVAPEEAHIIRSFAHFLRYFFIEMRRGLSADIGGSRDDRSFELCAERFAEGLIRDSDTDRSILGNQVWRQVPCMGINDRQRLGFIIKRSVTIERLCRAHSTIKRSAYQHFCCLRHIDIVVQLGCRIQQHKHRFGVFPFLEGIDLSHRLCVGRIAPYPPHRIRRIDYDSSFAQHTQCLLQIFFLIFLIFFVHTGEPFTAAKLLQNLHISKYFCNFARNLSVFIEKWRE